MPIAAVTALVPTWVSAGQPPAGNLPLSSTHWGVACGLTLSPTGRSTRTVFRLPTGTSVPGIGTPGTNSAGACRVMIWVKPADGWPAAWVKNWFGVLVEHWIGKSLVQVPACQPICGD